MQTNFDIATKGFCPPITVVLVGTVTEGNVNFMEVGWCMIVNLKPPMLAVSLEATRYSIGGIKEHGEFSVCIPDASMKDVADYCGLFSGRDKDKAQLFDVFYSASKNMPLIQNCPVNLECVVKNTIEIPGRYIFVANIISALARQDVMEDGRPVIEKIDPLLMTMRDNRYWRLGEIAGRAWKDGALYAPEVPHRYAPKTLK